MSCVQIGVQQVSGGLFNLFLLIVVVYCYGRPTDMPYAAMRSCAEMCDNTKQKLLLTMQEGKCGVTEQGLCL